MPIPIGSCRRVRCERAGQQGVGSSTGVVECERVATLVEWSADGDRGVAGYVSGYAHRAVVVSHERRIGTTPRLASVHVARWTRVVQLNRNAEVVAQRFGRLTGHQVDSWQGISSLPGNDIAESSTLDFKVRPYDDPKKDQHDRNDELRKDVTALANAIGGVLVLGVAEKDGRATKVLPFGSLDAVEGNLRSVLRSRIWPPLDHVEIVPVVEPATSDGCLLVVVPASPRKPHAVQPHGDAEALKYALRVGRHTQWLSESQVADLYRARYQAARTQAERVDEILDDLRTRLAKRLWLLLALVPDVPGQFVVSREGVHEAEQWWGFRDALRLLPPLWMPSATASAGPRRVRLSHSDGQTSVPSEVYAELHDDGSCGLAVELNDGPSGNPSFFLDELVASVVEGLAAIAGLSGGAAGAGGYALLAACLHVGGTQGELQAWDPSWAPPDKPLGTCADPVVTRHTIDLDAVHHEPQELVAAAGIVAGHLAQFFGQPDAQYITPEGSVRVQQFRADIRDKVVKPRAKELGVLIEDSL